MDPTVTVKLASGTYPIYVGEGLLSRAGELLGGELDPASRDVVMIDANVQDYFNDSLLPSLKKAFAGEAFAGKARMFCYEVPAGERSKSIEQLQNAWLQMIEQKIDRSSTVIALGGGVTGDLAGFVAATYMRGLNFVQVPTTLLAQVDSSVGGKTGINLPMAKNSAGAFWQPAAVIIDPAVLRTLEPHEYTSGLAEVVKYGVIMDQEFFGFLESSTAAINDMDMPTLEKVITRCCELKAEVVQQDERETSGRRATLNYGHTFGHAIESVFGYGVFPHGHAVAMGMHVAACLAKLMNRVDDEFVSRQNSLLAALNIPCSFPTDRHQDLLEAMQHDKKAKLGEARFVLPTRLGHVELVSSVDRETVLEAMTLACQATE